VSDTIIRPVRDGEIPAVTLLLHRAYARLAAGGLHFVAAHQDDDTTRTRIRGGVCLVAERDGAIVGTITYLPPGEKGGCDWYERDDVAEFEQYAVEPALQGTGIGERLLGEAERRAIGDGAAELACDTAAPATGLIAMYRRRGYRIVQPVDWRPFTNYESVVLSKRLSGKADGSAR